MTTVFYLSFLEREEFLPNFLQYFFLWCFHIIKKLEEMELRTSDKITLPHPWHSGFKVSWSQFREETPMAQDQEVQILTLTGSLCCHFEP